MRYNIWKICKITITSIVAIGVLVIYSYLSMRVNVTIPSNEIITLPVSGISMPYWLLNALGYILLPGFFALIVYSFIDKLEERYA